MAIVLHQFRGSHFNEKARWALAFKQVAHRRQSHLPGPHRVTLKRLSGQSTTPVLELEGEMIAGSTPIIEALEVRFPVRPLLHGDESAREAARALVARFDAEIGPATRTVAFSVFVNELDYVAALFAGDRPWAQRTLYRAALPIVRPLMARANGADDPSRVTRALETCDSTLDWLERETASKAYLVGDRFSMADLTLAALLSPIAEIEHPEVTRPKPVPEAFERQLARWRGHAALDWVRRQYRDHRPAESYATERPGAVALSGDAH